MASRLLRKQLRKILMAAPVIASAGCWPGGPFGPHPLPCGGGNTPFHQFVATADAGLSDGGEDCSLCECFALSCVTATQNADAGLDCTCAHLCEGRRPSDLVLGRGSNARHPVGALFAEIARLEAASVRAFEVLEVELTAHGAPRRLVDRARRSSNDEIRHARATGALARRYGAEPLRPDFSGSGAVRPLEELARENAREGCVRETFGVLVATWQGEHAGDPKIAHAMRRIASDELRHAELAWDVDSWAQARLGARARRAVRQERVEAMSCLKNEWRLEPSHPCAHLAGLPSAQAAAALVDGLGELV